MKHALYSKYLSNTYHLHKPVLLRHSCYPISVLITVKPLQATPPYRNNPKTIQLSQLHTEDTDFPTTLSPYSKHIPLFPMVFSQEGLHCNTFFIRTDIRLYQIWANYVSYTLLYYRVKNPTQQPGNKIIISFTNC